jgi:hypothetical protein
MTMKNKLLYWAPRILAIFAILFMMMFSIDCMENEAGEILLCFLMHNIPGLIIILVLIIAWKWELVGGFLFVVAFFAGSIYFKGFGRNWGALIIMIPFLLTGILFMLHYFIYFRVKQPEHL